MTDRPRVAIIGARRHRQGLGPYVARALVAAGAEVPGFLGTSPATVASAGDELRRVAGIDARGHVDPATLLEEGPLDAVAILSPAGTHRRWLEWALDAGLAVLCEKPFVWGGLDELEAAPGIVGLFAERGLPLWENCQWPYTLPAYGELHPEATRGPPAAFAMQLSPAVTGAQMIGDSLPHVLSVLAAVAPATGEAPVREVSFSSRDEGAGALAVRFTWAADAGPVDVRVELARQERQPRTAGYALDGRWAHRVVRARDYAQFFVEGARLVDVPDPLHALVDDFVAALRGDRPPGDRQVRWDWPPDPRPSGRRIVLRMAALAELLRSWQRGPP